MPRASHCVVSRCFVMGAGNGRMGKPILARPSDLLCVATPIRAAP